MLSFENVPSRSQGSVKLKQMGSEKSFGHTYEEPVLEPPTTASAAIMDVKQEKIVNQAVFDGGIEERSTAEEVYKVLMWSKKSVCLVYFDLFHGRLEAVKYLCKD